MTDRDLTAQDVVAALRNKHHSDVFVTELSDRSSTCRLDAWAMPKSWSHWTTIGYEVKVSRADFLRDDKWGNYLPLCHEFYFVCPWGLIDPREIPDGAGLLYVTKTGLTRAKLRAPRRAIDFPQGIFIRLAMNSVGFSSMNSDPCEQMPQAQRRTARIEDMRLLLESKQSGRLLGRQVSETLAKRVADAELRAREAQARMQKLERVEALLERLGLTEWQWGHETVVENALSKAMGAVDPRLVGRLRRSHDSLARLIEELEREAPSLQAEERP